MLKIISIMLTVLFLQACEKEQFTTSKTFAGNKVVTAETLNLGKNSYIKYCISCHGEKGDGNGIASKGMLPPARDFTKGIYKFGTVATGGLPHDADFYRIIRGGLAGTAMLKWDISDERMDAITQYIKTFAPNTWEGSDKTLGDPIIPSANPFVGNVEKGIARGKEVFHVVSNCTTCHRAYVSHEELNQMSIKINNTKITEFEPEMYNVKLQDSEHGYKVTPPDFTWHLVRSASTVEELYVRIAAGVGGTSMPGWKDVLSEEDLWAVSYYVKYLTTLKDSPARAELLTSIEKK